MIHSVTVTNFHGDSIEMELAKPGKTGFLISNIEGIAPGSANINVMDVATLEGGLYTGAKMGTRSITMSIIFMGDYTIEDLRHKCYKYFPIKKKTRLQFNTDNRSTWIEGYVETHDVEIFSDMETAAVTLLCPDPYFRDTNQYDKTFDAADPLFEFPFSNESLDQKLIEFGSIKHMTEHYILYEGDADTSGCVITLELIGPVHDLRLYNRSTLEYGDRTGIMIIKSSAVKAMTGIDISGDTPDGFMETVLGCKIVVSTVKGDKYVRFIDSNGKVYDVIGAIDRNNFSWLYLVPGENIIVFATNGSADEDMNCIVTIDYDTLYGGV